MASQQAAGVRLQRALEEAQRWKAVAHQAQHGRTTATPGTELPVDAAQLLAGVFWHQTKAFALGNKQ